MGELGSSGGSRRLQAASATTGPCTAPAGRTCAAPAAGGAFGHPASQAHAAVRHLHLRGGGRVGGAASAASCSRVHDSTRNACRQSCSSTHHCSSAAAPRAAPCHQLPWTQTLPGCCRCNKGPQGCREAVISHHSGVWPAGAGHAAPPAPHASSLAAAAAPTSIPPAQRPHRMLGAACVLTTVVRAPPPTWLVQIRRTPVLQEGARGGACSRCGCAGARVHSTGGAGAAPAACSSVDHPPAACPPAPPARTHLISA